MFCLRDPHAPKRTAAAPCAVIAVALFSLVSPAQSQEAAGSEQETIRQLTQQVRELQDRVKALEAQPPQADVPASQTQAPQTRESTPEGRQDAGSENSQHEKSLNEVFHDSRSVQWRGFGEVDYKALDQKHPGLGTYGFVSGSAGNFYTGEFTLLLTARINDKASVLSEMVFGEEDAQSFGVDLERVLFKYDYNDHLKLSLGRYHTTIGYYNTAYHSGAWLQTLADRPSIMEFADEGGPLPTQAVGFSTTGLIPSGRLGLNYVFEYGSSDTISPNLTGRGRTDENNGNHINAGWFVRPDSVPGLQIGSTVYHDRISDFVRGPSVRLGQTIANGHIVFEGRKLELLNEAFYIRHAYEHSSIIYNMPAFYSQVSRRIWKARPFFRYQYTNANSGSLLQDHGLRHGPSFGARYDFDDNFALKAQLDHTVRKGQPDLNGLHMQLAYTF